MQTNHVDNGHRSSNHRVTDCIREQSNEKESAGGMKCNNTASLSGQQSLKEEFSFSTWMGNLNKAGKSLLRKIWGESPGKGVATKTKQTPGILSEQDSAKTAEVASTLIQQKSKDTTPYFSAIEDKGEGKQQFYKKIKIRFQDVTGQLSQRFSKNNSFQSKQQEPKENLRRKSRYKDEDREINCVVTDDSYLMDSYNRNGEYSTLTTTKKK
ncbi:hypothetical protein LJC58_03495 [Lachnospiraceae bacterium OttesenSCG-928-D06]|nr:hypothetical protein [Lachnospiraceae bacterium OttesenSCG-928-D06]